MRRVIDRMHMREVTIAYGMTETSPISFQSNVDDPIDRRVATVGRIHPHVEVKIVDESSRIVPLGRAGELCTRGYCVMRGYWEDAERTRESIDAAGWMHTGDLATIDAEGYCNIVGRVKDMLIRGGENVYPREIEEFLFGHPKVQAAQVFGVPDPRLGEAPAAFVVAAAGAVPDEAVLLAWAKERLANYKVPRHLWFVDELPLNAVAKIDKVALAERSRALLAG